MTNNTEQEPVAEIDEHGRLVLGLNWNQVPFGSKLYAAPVRTKDLTDAELDALWYGNTEGGWRGLFRAVIAADREKNK